MPQPLRQKIVLDLSQSRRAYLKHRARLRSLSDEGRRAAEGSDEFAMAAAAAGAAGADAADDMDDFGKAAWLVGQNTETATEAIDEAGDAMEAAGAAGSVAAEAVDETGDAVETAGKKSKRSAGFFKRTALRISDMTDSGLAFLNVGLNGTLAAIAATVAGLAAYFGGTSAAAITFETAMIDVRKTTGLTGEALNKLGDELLDIASRVGVGRREMAEIAATAGQLGIEGAENIATFSETIAQMTKVTELSADDAASSLARISNAFDLPIEKSKNLASVLNVLSNNSTALAGDLVETLTRGVAAAGREIGVTVDEAAALGATLIDAGVSSRRAGVALRNIFTRISAEAATAAEQMGITEEQFRGMISEDAVGALRAYLDNLRQVEPQMRAVNAANVFGERAGIAVATLAGQLGTLGDLLPQASAQLKEATSFSREFALSLDAVSRQAGLVWSKFKVWATGMGQQFLPVMDEFLRYLNRIYAGSEELTRQIEAIREEQKQLGQAEGFLETYERLTKLRGETELTAQQTRTLRRATDALAERFPNYVKETNAAGEAISLYAGSIEGAIRAQREMLQLQESGRVEDLAEQFLGRSDETFIPGIATLENGAENLAALREEHEKLNEEIAYTEKLLEATRKTGGKTWLLERQLKNLRGDFEELGADVGEAEANMRNAMDGLQVLFGDLSVEANVQDLRDDLKTKGWGKKEIDALIDRIQRMNKALESSSGPLRHYPASMNPAGSELPSFADENPTDTLTDDQKQAIAAARDALDAYQRSAELAAASTDEVRQALQDVHDAQARIRELERIGETLGTAAVADEMKAEKERLRLARARVGQEKALNEWLKMNAEAMNGAGKAVMEAMQTPDTLNQLQLFNDQFGEYQQKVSKLRAQLASGAIGADEFGRRMAQAGRDALEEMRPLLKALVEVGLLTQEQMDKAVQAIEEVESGASDAGGSLQEAGDTLQSIAGAVDGVARLADAFGDMDGKVRKALDSTASLLSNVGRLVASGGTDVGAWIGTATSVGGLLASVLSGGSGEGDRRWSSDVHEMTRELKKNAEAVRENTRALRGDRTSKIGRETGGFEKSVGGATERLEFLEEQGLMGAQETFRDYISNLQRLDLSAGRGREVGIAGGKSLAEILQDAQGLDLSTASGRERLQQLQKMIAEAIASNNFRFGSLKQEGVRDILSVFEDFASDEGPASGGEDQWSRSQSISRTVTEFQANELVALQNETVYLLGAILASLVGGEEGAASVEDVKQFMSDLTVSARGPLPLESDPEIRQSRDIQSDVRTGVADVGDAAERIAEGQGNPVGIDGEVALGSDPAIEAIRDSNAAMLEEMEKLTLSADVQRLFDQLATPPATPDPRLPRSPVVQTPDGPATTHSGGGRGRAIEIYVTAEDPPERIAEKMEEAAERVRLF